MDVGGVVVSFWESVDLRSEVTSWFELLFVSGSDLRGLEELSAAEYTREECDNDRAERVEIGLLAIVRTARRGRVQSMGLKLMMRAQEGFQETEGVAPKGGGTKERRQEENETKI